MTVYDLRWARTGVWTRVHDGLRDLVGVHAGREPLPTAAIIDSQTVRDADTVPSANAGYDTGKRPRAASATSPWTQGGCCWPSWSPPPASRTATGRTACSWRCTPGSAP
jgi:hypothetical protein